MHMADAFLSPAVGGGMWALAVSAGGYSLKKSRETLAESSRIVSLTGVSAAFIFAAQMINFTIPGTGSSGHISGALFLTILLGPYLSFLAMATILIIQAFFFADGGILALGSNLMNMAFFMNFLAYPLIFKRMRKRSDSRKNLFAASILTAVAGLQFGSLGVVAETFFSGRVTLPYGTFLILMQSVHLAIGLIEGLITAVLVGYLFSQAPDLFERSSQMNRSSGRGERFVPLLGAAALLTGTVLSLFASELPDGLEWSLENVTVRMKTGLGNNLHNAAEWLQARLSFLPDYGARSGGIGPAAGTVLSGIVGVLLTLAVISLFLFLARGLRRKRSSAGDI